MASTSTRISRHVNAPRANVYRALLDSQAIAIWRVPSGMTSHVHEFDARVGGSFRISLTYNAPTGTGKSTAHTDTYHGHFIKLVPDEQVVEVMEFETADPAMRGETPGGTLSCMPSTSVPPGVSPADNETGWRMALDNLAALVERGWNAQDQGDMSS